MTTPPPPLPHLNEVFPSELEILLWALLDSVKHLLNLSELNNTDVMCS